MRKYFVSYIIWYTDTCFETHNAFVTIRDFGNVPMSQYNLEKVMKEIYEKKGCNEKNTSFINFIVLEQ